jgi:hypothetical protein
MESLTLRKWSGWFLTGSALVNTVVFSFIILSLTFILGQGLAAWQFPVALAISLVLNHFTALHFVPGTHKMVFLKSSAIVLLVIIGSVFISGFFYDISSDGQMYHMESAIQMKYGWNPFRQELPADFNQAIWLNHYGKGVEDPQATIYAFTHRLETSKATNFILVVASFCLAMAFLVKLDRFSLRKNLLFSILLALSPVTFYQLLNTYVDGQLCSFLLCFIATACLLYLSADRYYLILLASILIMLVNIKFTSLVFAAIFTAGMLLVFLVSRKYALFKKSLIVASLATAFGIGVVGYFPYVINTVQYHNILYPGLPMLKSEALKFTPPVLRNRNPLSKFLLSFFSHTDNLHLTVTKNPVIRPKIPFTVNKTDIFNASKPYVVFIAGLGPFFSGICLSALCIFGYYFWKLKDKRLAVPVIVLAGTILFSVLIISEAWYARYIPQLWFFPLVLLIASETIRGKLLNRIRWFLYLIMLVNISFCLASFPYVYYKTEQIKYELAQLKASGETIPVEFTYFTSNRERFIELGIPFREVPIPDSVAVYMSSSSTKMIPPKQMPNLPRSLALRLGDRIVNRFHLQ